MTFRIFLEKILHAALHLLLTKSNQPQLKLYEKHGEYVPLSSLSKKYKPQKY